MVSETPVVRMFLNGHDLKAVITILDDSRKDIILEFRIGAHLFCILGHPYMTFIDQQRRSCRYEFFLLPHIAARMPYLCGKYFCLVVLDDPLCPGGDPLSFPSVPVHMHLIQLAMADGILRKMKFPVSGSLKTGAAISIRLLPSIEIAHQADARCMRSPLTEHPAVSRLMESIIVITVSKVAERHPAVLRQLVQFPYRMIVSSTDRAGIRFQIWIILYNSHFRFLRFIYHDD